MTGASSHVPRRQAHDDRDRDDHGDDVAFCHGLTHMTGTKTDGEQVDLWFRSTVGLRRAAEGWQITHEHDSTPFYMDGSGLAATDLRP
jgi:PhnB protein